MNYDARVYFELLRFPAVFTAIADVMMGYLITHGDFHQWLHFVLLIAASSSLYLAGLVLNDVFDAAVDAEERPHRPIPSGRIALDSAKRLGWGLLIVGILFGWTVAWLTSNGWPGIVGSLLACCIVLYDGVFKRHPIAPLFMGTCRFLNVLLGMSLATSLRWPFEPNWQPFEVAIAVGIGTYITGLTWFARREAHPGNRPRLLAGTLVMLLGLLVLNVSGRMQLRPAQVFAESENWQWMWLALAAVILGRCVWAVWRLEPRATQIAVRNSLRALVVIDAAIVLGFVGPAPAVSVLVLLLPMLFLERWASTT